jgi:hypothetical protein
MREKRISRRTKRDRKNFDIMIRCWLFHKRGIRNGTAKPRNYKANKEFSRDMRECRKLVRRRHYRRAAEKLKRTVGT